jgi:pimeloyl-ACP methyl ester carboxylesterase
MMRWRKAAAAGGAALSAAALYNASATHGIPTLENELGGESCELLWRGHRVAYTRRGRGEPVLLVHGIYAGASSNEWRHTVDSLAERYTVFTVDLVGFGRSDRPRLRYTPAFYQAFLGDVMNRLGRGPLAVVATSLSAALVVTVAARDPRHVAALALIEPTGLGQLSGPPTAAQSAAQLLLEAPIVGTSAYNALTSPASVRRYLEAAYSDDRLVTDDLVESYMRNARQPGGKYAVAAFVGGQLNVDLRQSLRRVRQPMLLLWGEQARENPVQHAHGFRVLKPEADWALIKGAGDLPHDEQPRATNEALHRFLERVRDTQASRPSTRANR